jgi:alginate O-acetyltransferase complex protein AlgI
MIFNSLAFVCFFAVILALFHLTKSWNVQKWLLLIASYVFYMGWSPPFVLLLWISTVLDWFLSGRMARAATKESRRGWLLLSLGANLGMLGYFKYGDFLLENFHRLAGLDGPLPDSGIVLPVGISFYTFETLSYTIDVYRGAKPVRSLRDFALYLAFFPHLVAGPIMRSWEFVPQCKARRRVGAEGVAWGLFLITLGLFQKVVLADALLAESADKVFATFAPVGFVDAWAGVVAFSLQLFCDFSGYSTCAIGAAVCFGFSLPENFRAPYAAIGFQDFWRRWHITLSTWLRDYVYISLGGSRRGRMRTAGNLLLTMLIGGLWHGASWTFVAWGAVHGALLVFERRLRGMIRPRAWMQAAGARVALGLATFLIVSLVLVLFRAKDFYTAAMIFVSLFGVLPGVPMLSMVALLQIAVVATGILVAQWRFRDTSLFEIAKSTPMSVLGLAWVVMLAGIVLAQNAGNAFLYFQF